MQKIERDKSLALNAKLPTKVQKQRINSLKQQLELTLRELAAPAVGAVLGKALEMALNGDRNMIRLILELHMSKPTAQEDSSAGKSQVLIQINNLTDKKKSVVEVIDVEATTPGSDGNSEEHAQVHSDGSQAGVDHGE